MISSGLLPSALRSRMDNDMLFLDAAAVGRLLAGAAEKVADEVQAVSLNLPLQLVQVGAAQ